jgi:hypothetical protein
LNASLTTVDVGRSAKIKGKKMASLLDLIFVVEDVMLPRFQRKQYANIEIVLTKKKGYGLRAEEDLPK